MTNPEGHLEPRVAAIEAQLTTLTSDVSDLVGAVRKQGEQMGALALAIERVSAPKQANWLALIGTVVSVVLLFVTIGSLVLYPMTKEITHLQAWSVHHSELELHPVGKTRIDALERRLDLVTAEGSPRIQNRLTVLEEKMKKLEAKQ